MALPTEITSMNSLAAAWEDGVDAVNAAQAGRVVQPDNRVVKIPLASTGFMTSHPIGEITTWAKFKIDALSNGDTTFFETRNPFCIWSLQASSSRLVMYADAGGFHVYPLTQQQVASFEGIDITAVCVFSDTTARLRFSHDPTIQFDLPNNTGIAPTSASEFYFCGLHNVSAPINGSLYECGIYSGDVGDTNIASLIASNYPGAPWAHWPLTDLPTAAEHQDISGNARDVTFRNTADEYGTGSFNGSGYANTTAHSNLIIPLDSSDLAPNYVAGMVTTFTGPAAIGLASYQIPERYRRFVAAGDGGFFDNSGSLADVDGLLYFGTVKATVNSSLPYQQTYAKNLISYDDNGITRTVLLDENHDDYADDLVILQDIAGIAEPSIKLTGLTSGSKVLINGVATIVAGTEHTTPTLAAFADYEIRIAHPDKKSIILSTFVSAGIKEVAVTQEDLTVPLTHNGSLLTQFALNGNVLEVTDEDDTFDIQLAEAWLRFNDFDDPGNPWFSKHHLIHPAQLVVDKDMEQIMNTKVTACSVTNGVITKNVVTSPYSAAYGGFTINGVFQGEGL